jgi:hypothetical protein
MGGMHSETVVGFALMDKQNVTEGIGFGTKHLPLN